VRTKRRYTLLAALCAALSVQPAASAQTPAEIADALFKEGRQLYDARRFEEACTKLAESDRLRPTVNTVGLLAACHEELGMLASAWREYQAAAKRARAAKDEREAFARERAAALDPKLPRLTLRLMQPEPGIAVKRNGEPVPEDEIGAEVPVDPGVVEIVARAPGKLQWRGSVTMDPGMRQTVEIPALMPDEKANPFVPPNGNGGGSSGLRIAGFVAGGVGLAGIAVGAGFGLAAIGRNNEANDAGCEGKVCPTDAAADLRRDARSLALVSTIGFGAGLACAGAGVALILISSGGDAPAPSAGLRLIPAAGPGGAGALVTGSF
jgi:hypothetical protein